MQIDRTTIISGPAKITYGGQSFWSKGDIVERPITDRFAIQHSHFGDMDLRETNREYEITFEPDGRFTNAIGAILFPYRTLAMGASIIGSTDRALVVHGRDGKKRTYHNAALTKIPDGRFDAASTMQGSCTFTAICKNNTAPTDPAAYFTDATEPYPGDTGWDISDIVTAPLFSAAWGSTPPWDGFKVKNGFVLSVDLDIFKRKVSGIGTVDLILKGMTVKLKATPLVSRESVASMMRADTEMGASINTNENLNFTNGIIDVSISNAAIVDASFVSGMENERVGEVTWQAIRTIAGGELGPLYLVEVV